MTEAQTRAIVMAILVAADHVVINGTGAEPISMNQARAGADQILKAAKIR